MSRRISRSSASWAGMSVNSVMWGAFSRFADRGRLDPASARGCGGHHQNRWSAFVKGQCSGLARHSTGETRNCPIPVASMEIVEQSGRLARHRRPAPTIHGRPLGDVRPFRLRRPDPASSAGPAPTARHLRVARHGLGRRGHQGAGRAGASAHARRAVHQRSRATPSAPTTPNACSRRCAGWAPRARAVSSR